MSLQMNAFGVRLFAMVMRFGAWLMALPNKLTPPPFRLIQISSAFWHSRALYVAARLDIATQLGNGEQEASQIAAGAQADTDAVRRLLRMLAALGIFEETRPGHFRNNRLSDALRQDRPDNVRAMILMHNADFMTRPWFEQLERGVREGTAPFKLTHGEDLFTWLDHEPEADALFSAAMDSVEALAGDSYATDFDWGRFERLIDLGGSRGTKALAILKHHPRLSAVVVDRPQVVEEAVRHWATHPTDGTERLQFVAGNLHDAVPAARNSRDIYLLSAVLHGLDDAGCATILANIATATGATGARVAVLEMIMPELHADVASTAFDMQMFMGTRGRERTLTEWKRLFTRVGMELEEVVGLRSFANILVLRRAPSGAAH